MECSNLIVMPTSPHYLSHPAYLPTTKRRRGRVTRRQASALMAGSDYLVGLDAWADLNARIEQLTGSARGYIVDVGFGSADPVLEMARHNPAQVVVAVDVHTPGIGDLIAGISEGDVSNVVVIESDVREVLTRLHVGSLAGVRTFYPDPWPKKKHESRRLVTEAFARELAAKVEPDGRWHMATDWLPYAEHMKAQIVASGCWQGGVVDRPEWRPVTRYERHAIAAGRDSIDLWFVRDQS